MKGFITLTHRNSGTSLTIATAIIGVIAPVRGKEKQFTTLTLTIPFTSDGNHDLPVTESPEEVMQLLTAAQ